MWAVFGVSSLWYCLIDLFDGFGEYISACVHWNIAASGTVLGVRSVLSRARHRCTAKSRRYNCMPTMIGDLSLWMNIPNFIASAIAAVYGARRR